MEWLRLAKPFRITQPNHPLSLPRLWPGHAPQQHTSASLGTSSLADISVRASKRLGFILSPVPLISTLPTYTLSVAFSLFLASTSCGVRSKRFSMGRKVKAAGGSPHEASCQGCEKAGKKLDRSAQEMLTAPSDGNKIGMFGNEIERLLWARRAPAKTSSA